MRASANNRKSQNYRDKTRESSSGAQYFAHRVNASDSAVVRSQEHLAVRPLNFIRIG
jgi:hypothetical protein